MTRTAALAAETAEWKLEHTFGGYVWFPDVAADEPDEDFDEVKVLLVTGGYGRTDIDLTPAERAEAIRRLHAQQYDDIQIGERLGLAPKTAADHRRALNLAAWPRHERIAA